MNVPCRLLTLLVCALSISVEAEGPSLRIVAPASGSEAAMRVNVVVATEDAKGDPGDVVVVVHPLATPDYWVQPRGRPGKGRAWEVLAYLGRPGDVDVGKEFEIAAFAQLVSPLSEGDVLKGWPKAGLRSEAVAVKRK